MRLTLYVFLIVILTACDHHKSISNEEVKSDLTQILIDEENLTPTVDIKNFILLTSNFKRDSLEAREILKVERNFPLAMQKKDSLLFDQILGRTFSYRAEDEFFPNRQSYIKDRIYGSWTIDTVEYQNLVLQIFDKIAIITYRNILNGTDNNGLPTVEHYNWADIYVKEHGQWKISSVHEIESRIEYSNK